MIELPARARSGPQGADRSAAGAAAPGVRGAGHLGRPGRSGDRRSGVRRCRLRPSRGAARACVPPPSAVGGGRSAREPRLGRQRCRRSTRWLQEPRRARSTPAVGLGVSTGCVIPTPPGGDAGRPDLDAWIGRGRRRAVTGATACAFLAASSGRRGPAGLCVHTAAGGSARPSSGRGVARAAMTFGRDRFDLRALPHADAPGDRLCDPAAG